MMTATARDMIPGILNGYDFGRFTHVVDVGGGHGLFARAIATKHPNVRVTCYDTLSVIESAPKPAMARDEGEAGGGESGGGGGGVHGGVHGGGAHGGGVHGVELEVRAARVGAEVEVEVEVEVEMSSGCMFKAVPEGDCIVIKVRRYLRFKKVKTYKQIQIRVGDESVSYHTHHCTHHP